MCSSSIVRVGNPVGRMCHVAGTISSCNTMKKGMNGDGRVGSSDGGRQGGSKVDWL